MLCVDGLLISDPLSGFFEVIVDELAFAELNIGVISFRLDVFKIHKCYKAAVRYDMNFLKVSFNTN